MLDVSFVMSCCWLTVSLWVAKLITLRSVTDLFTFYYYMMKQMHQVQKVSEPQTTSDLITAVSYRVCLLSVIYYFKQISMWYAAIRFCNNNQQKARPCFFTKCIFGNLYSIFSNSYLCWSVRKKWFVNYIVIRTTMLLQKLHLLWQFIQYF